MKVSYNDFTESIYSYIWVDIKTFGTYKYAQDNNPQQVKIEYSVDQLKSLISYVEKDTQPTFEIGKWYKYKNWYLKLGSIEDNIFRASEQIDSLRFTEHSNFNAGFLDSEKVLLTDLTEIQQYLPDGHVDKVKKYEYEVVHCTTQKEWDFVIDTLGFDQKRKKDFEVYGKNKSYCKNIKRDSFSQDLDFYKKNSLIYSFQEWCDKFGHINPLNEKIEPWSVGTYVVITEFYHRVKIGEVHKISDVIDGLDRRVNISKSVGVTCLPTKSSVKWFATLKEAEEFSKTLTKTEVSMNDSDLLEEAKRRYPVGTTFKSALKHDTSPITTKVVNHTLSKTYGRIVIWGGPIGFLYDDGKWAEIVSTPDSVKEFKSERFVETMKFFNQLQEPYRSQAIANYDEMCSLVIPKTLDEAIIYGFEWGRTDKDHGYWKNFRESLNTFSSRTGLGIDNHIYGKTLYDNRGVKDFIENPTKTEPKLLKIDFKSKTIVKEEKLSSIIKLVKPKQILKIK